MRTMIPRKSPQRYVKDNVRGSHERGAIRTKILKDSPVTDRVLRRSVENNVEGVTNET